MQTRMFEPVREVALSVRQPWAWLIVAGHKDIENRTWQVNYRGPLLIHAAGRPGDMTLGEIERWQGRKFPLDRPHDFGGVIGRVELVDIVTRSTSPWFEGPFGWVFRNPEILPWRPCKGLQSLFEPDYRERPE